MWYSILSPKTRKEGAHVWKLCNKAYMPDPDFPGEGWPQINLEIISSPTNARLI
jgi:hypothetical protein